MKENRRSLLQIKILLQLEEKPAKTVAELAQRVNAQRPSVSRSLWALKEQGLVFRNRQGWHSTEAGKTEASVAKEKLVETSIRIKDATLRVPDLLKANSTGMAYIATIVDQFAAITKSSTLTAALARPAILDIVINLGKSNSPLLSTEFYESSLKPFLQIQERNNSLFQQMLVSQVSILAETVVNQNSQLLGKTIDDLLAIRHEVASKAIGKVLATDFSWLVKDISLITQKFSQVFNEQIEKISGPFMSAAILQSTESFIVPTSIVASYTRSARGFVDAEVESDIPLLPINAQTFKEFGDQTLDPLLYKLNPDYVDMRQGAWVALSQSNPDRLRHAAISQRELLGQILEQLVPNSQLPKENRQGPQLKARIRIALKTGEGDAEFIEAVNGAVVAFYGQLSKYTHHNVKHEESLRALLHTGEGLIRFILSKI